MQETKMKWTYAIGYAFATLLVWLVASQVMFTGHRVEIKKNLSLPAVGAYRLHHFNSIIDHKARNFSVYTTRRLHFLAHCEPE
jgi:hypothetical protein